MSKCGKNISDICVLGRIMCAPFLFLPHFNIICDLLWNRNAATWNLFVNYRVDHILLREKKREVVPSLKKGIEILQQPESLVFYM